MQNWEKVYQNYAKTGTGKEILNEKILPAFKNFIKHSKFINNLALDIGCGKGKYLKYLQRQNFIITGIDISKTALSLAQKKLGKQVKLLNKDFYTYSLPRNTYGLIISIHSIHHGRKNQVRNAIKNIYQTLAPKGKVFITLPHKKMVAKWETYSNVKIIEDGTFIPQSGKEKGLIHSYFTLAEVREIFSKFTHVKILNKHTFGSLCIIAIK